MKLTTEQLDALTQYDETLAAHFEFYKNYGSKHVTPYDAMKLWREKAELLQMSYSDCKEYAEYFGINTSDWKE